MSLQFYFGPSGAGKSRMLYEEITRRALQNPRQNFLRSEEHTSELQSHLT